MKKQLLFGLLCLFIGFVIGIYVLLTQFVSKSELTNYFNKKDIIESHGSFDERINTIDERLSIIEDPTKGTRSK